MATTPQAQGGAQTTDSMSEVVNVAAEIGTTPESGPFELPSNLDARSRTGVAAPSMPGLRTSVGCSSLVAASFQVWRT